MNADKTERLAGGAAIGENDTGSAQRYKREDRLETWFSPFGSQRQSSAALPRLAAKPGWAPVRKSSQLLSAGMTCFIQAVTYSAISGQPGSAITQWA